MGEFKVRLVGESITWCFKEEWEADVFHNVMTLKGWKVERV